MKSRFIIMLTKALDEVLSISQRYGHLRGKRAFGGIYSKKNYHIKIALFKLWVNQNIIATSVD